MDIKYSVSSYYWFDQIPVFGVYASAHVLYFLLYVQFKVWLRPGCEFSSLNAVCRVQFGRLLLTSWKRYLWRSRSISIMIHVESYNWYDWVLSCYLCTSSTWMHWNTNTIIYATGDIMCLSDASILRISKVI